MMFQLTAPLREPTLYTRMGVVSTAFQLTAPLREPTRKCQFLQDFHLCFNSRLPCGSRLQIRKCIRRLRCFNSRLPCGSRPEAYSDPERMVDVSTHGSLAGADLQKAYGVHQENAFQLTAPLREPTVEKSAVQLSRMFQLTAPLREPTSCMCGTRHILSVSTHGSLAGADWTRP